MFFPFPCYTAPLSLRKFLSRFLLLLLMRVKFKYLYAEYMYIAFTRIRKKQQLKVYIRVKIRIIFDVTKSEFSMNLFRTIFLILK